MPFKRIFKGVPTEPLSAEGIFRHDYDAITPCQRDSINRVGKTLQMEQEAYLDEHPEIPAILELFLSQMVHEGNRKSNLAAAAKYFTRPIKNHDAEIREYLGLPQTGPYRREGCLEHKYIDYNLELDLKKILLKHNPGPEMMIPIPVISPDTTLSSSFISLVTSETTQPTPEPIPTPEPTLSEAFLQVVSVTVDKAVYSHVDEQLLRYDTAYVELMKAVEEAMEVPVIELREDLAELLFNAYMNFEADIMEKERIAAELAWERRIRKKMKRTLRRIDNFKGYASPSSKSSDVDSQHSIPKPPLRPCKCHPQYLYNRYPKDRFGIYLPTEVVCNDDNVTVTPVYSRESLREQETVTPATTDTKSVGGKSQH